jgi:nitronate monooxygenase
MPLTTLLTERLGIQHPIIQAPMAGASNAVLAAAVSNAGGLGGFGGTDTSPQDLRTVIRAIRERTSKPFIVNLYVPRSAAYVVPSASEEALKSALNSAHLALEAGDPPDSLDLLARADEQFAVVIEEKVPVFSSHFGLPGPSIVDALKANGTRIISTATTVEEALQLAAGGADAVIAQGSEAGGHRGTFTSDFERAAIGTMALVPQIADAISVPIIAAGGIMDGRGIAAAMMLGASGVQMGTAFVACPETSANPAYVRRLLSAEAGDAVMTDAVSGRPMRVLRNRLVNLLEQNDAHRIDFPEQLSMTRNLRRAALARSDDEFLPLWAGQGAPLARALPAAALVRALVTETENLLGCDESAALALAAL